ncbi:MAG TPA: DUF3089 domain-containing protein [Caulobacteraceae bacterium]|jgi:hypothetical protein|nr:DUF3089 domain-containing protein [Caulobacteraceae bacterium]
MARPRWRSWLILGGGLLVLAILVVVLIWRDDILEAFLDPQIPYTVYQPPPAPDYARRSAWDQLPAPADDHADADVFFIHPTTFDGGKDWNGPIGDPDAAALYARVVAPNYAAPFAAAGRVFAPRYRQASLYTSLTVFDDAIEAREFAYGDVRRAFDYFIAHLNAGRPFVLVGVEQGGNLAARLLREAIAPDPALRRRLIAAYLIDAVTLADDHGPSSPVPACEKRNQSGCAVGFISAREGDFPRVINIFSRSKVWDATGHLVNLAGRSILCVNPLLGAASEAEAPARLNLGAANATGLEWGTRPGFMVRQVGARCMKGILRVSRPRSNSLIPHGSWVERLRAPSYNLFWADLEADSLARLKAWRLSQRG